MFLHPQTPAEALYLLLGPQRQLHKELEPQSSPSSPDLASLYGWARHTQTHTELSKPGCCQMLLGQYISFTANSLQKSE